MLNYVCKILSKCPGSVQLVTRVKGMYSATIHTIHTIYYAKKRRTITLTTRAIFWEQRQDNLEQFHCKLQQFCCWNTMQYSSSLHI